MLHYTFITFTLLTYILYYTTIQYMTAKLYYRKSGLLSLRFFILPPFLQAVRVQLFTKSLLRTESFKLPLGWCFEWLHQQIGLSQTKIILVQDWNYRARLSFTKQLLNNVLRILTKLQPVPGVQIVEREPKIK